MDALALSTQRRRSGPVARAGAIAVPLIVAWALACFAVCPWQPESPPENELVAAPRASFDHATALPAASTPVDRSPTPPRHSRLDPRAYLDWWTINQRLRIRLYIPALDPIELQFTIPGQEPNGRYPLLFDGNTPY